jgi:hypothetical protein
VRNSEFTLKSATFITFRLISQFLQLILETIFFSGNYLDRFFPDALQRTHDPPPACYAARERNAA